MFHFYVVEDLISLEVGEYLSDARSHLSAKVSDKYVDKVIGGVGLVVLVDDILVQSEPKIMPNDACAMFTLRLRILVFAPGRDELLRGIVTSSDVTGISVSLGFFNDIKLIPLFMPPVSAFDADSSQWYTEVDGNRLYYKHQSEISFRVVDISYNELNDLSGDEHLPVMLIIGAPVETV
ncbi:RNA polymerase III subunit family protein [Babesia bovis T2Bo]|uniref:RNA polymerase III subunit Rpc25 domain-containing protein n=1 Tax=Babesia bovis TaxID=5865 RepID=A7ANP4_BABBO|nr:RNA polymerase III subunit family protein [Babesia bovis T2Bo]EDO08178.1 RNA polymerase III subunit family protein [Babesia bovis T2Bo]|eukprot:XP_001611746.1 hypothetical protein [Babesia bovis T2Bo]